MKPATDNKFSSVIAALGISAGLFAAPAVSQAEISSGMNVASMYLWRGQDISAGAPAVSGNVDYSIAGLTVGTWASSEGASGGMEWDVYASYGFKLGPVDLSVGYYEYMYPESGTDMSKTDASEYNVALSVVGVDLSVYKNTQTDYIYTSVGYSFGKIGLHVGSVSDKPADSDYIDASVSYSMSDNATVTISKVFADLATTTNLGLNDNPLMVFSYNIPL